MKKLFFLFLFFYGVASAHEYAIRPVDVELRIKENGVQATFTLDRDYVWEAILRVPFGATLPGTDWPAEIKQRAIDYLNKSFSLSVSSVALVSTAHLCQYIEEPYNRASSKFHFEAFYPIPPALQPLAGKKLSGKSTFFSEYKAYAEHDGGEEESIPSEFVSHILVVTEKPLKFDVTPVTPDFSVPIEKYIYSPSLERKETLKKNVMAISTSRPFVCVVLAIALLFWRKFVRPDNPALPDTTQKYRLICAVLLFTFAITETIFIFMKN